MSVESYEEQILKAVEILTDGAIKDLRFDKSILATVESIQDITTGEHKVRFQDGVFSAFSSSPGLYYAPGSLVYVQIPQGDFSERKIILSGKTTLPNNELAEYVNDFIENKYSEDAKAWIQSWWTPSDEDPADSWTDSLAVHEGDFWYQTDTNNYFRYTLGEGGVYQWEIIQGINAVTGLLSNENANIFGAEDGTVTPQNLADASGIFYVYDGQSLATGVTYSIVADSEVNCTASIDSNGNYTLTSFATDKIVASVTFKAIYNSVEIKKTFSVNKQIATNSPRLVKLESPSYVVVYEANGQSPSPGSYEVTATPTNTIGTVYYEFFIDGVSQGEATTTNTFIYNVQPLWVDMPQTIGVKIREGSATGDILASDSITIGGIKPGTDGTNTYKVEIVTAQGNIFKNGEGAAKTLTAKLSYGGTEIDLSGTSYLYTWSKYDNSGAQDLTFNKTGKSIIIETTDVDDMATFSVAVNEL